MRTWLLLIVSLMLISTVFTVGLAWYKVRQQPTNPALSAHVVDGPMTGQGPRLQLSLTDLNGHQVTDATLLGHHVLLYFGYTFCPDVCPTELGFMSRVMKQLGPQADDLRVYFISVDPQRDTATRLTEYTPYFDKRFQSLVGTDADIHKAATSVGAVYSKVTPVDAAPGFYLMNHSKSVFHIGPDGHVIDTFSSDDGLDAIVTQLRTALESTP